MPKRESICCILIFFFLLICFSYTMLNTALRLKNRDTSKKIEYVNRYALTDFCIFNDARYTRHISQADYFSPFQDNPSAFDIFPSGSLVLPPFLKTSHVQNN